MAIPCQAVPQPSYPLQPFLSPPNLFPPPSQALSHGLSQLAARHPLGRVGYAGEVGRVVAFLASAGAGFMTGSVVSVDGGALMTSAFDGGLRGALEAGRGGFPASRL